MASSLIGIYDDIIVILMSQQLKSGSLYCFFVFGWIKLRCNFELLISNLNSKSQYQFEILRKMQISPALTHELVTEATMNELSSIF